ncbi:hypothetical protein FGO68_gene14981 [Halteria grandinella]|uniref:Uncharacterized protein n=1 Tax=Halteria grandinella TaxID=5974 RepID=A0A8J8NMN7_HALGN|nr:hypothetical protein FGO68_gene14981 [Halteria grandinella]
MEEFSQYQIYRTFNNDALQKDVGPRPHPSPSPLATIRSAAHALAARLLCDHDARAGPDREPEGQALQHRHARKVKQEREGPVPWEDPWATIPEVLLHEEVYSHHDAQCEIAQPPQRHPRYVFQAGHNHEGKEMHNEGRLTRQLPITNETREN